MKDQESLGDRKHEIKIPWKKSNKQTTPPGLFVPVLNFYALCTVFIAYDSLAKQPDTELRNGYIRSVRGAGNIDAWDQLAAS